MNKDELQPCPFCGGTKICTEKGINLNYCDNCSAESNVEHWNTRPIEDALKQRIAELEAQQRWILITTKESLPKEEGSYLGYIKYPGGEYFQEEVEYSNKYGWMLDECIDITHWMPLPEPPEVK